MAPRTRSGVCIVILWLGAIISRRHFSMSLKKVDPIKLLVYCNWPLTVAEYISGTCMWESQHHQPPCQAPSQGVAPSLLSGYYRCNQCASGHHKNVEMSLKAMTFIMCVCLSLGMPRTLVNEWFIIPKWIYVCLFVCRYTLTCINKVGEPHHPIPLVDYYKH